MFFKTKVSLLISAVLANQAFAESHTTEEPMVPAETMTIVGSEFAHYKNDTNNTAMRMEMTQLETPGQITVIDSSMFEEQGASSLGEVLEYESSVTTGNTKGHNIEYFTMRGFDVGSGSGIMRDGHQLWSYYPQPTELLERVEVLKGPSSLLYGQSEPGGLINMVTKKPTSETQLILRQDIGSNDKSKTMIDLSGSLNEDQSLRARTILVKDSYRSWREYADGSNPQTERMIGALMVDYDINEKAMLSLHYDYFDYDGDVDTGSYIVDGKPVAGSKYIWDADWANTDIKVQNYGFDLLLSPSYDTNIKTGYNAQRYERDYRYTWTNFSNYEENGTVTLTPGEQYDEWNHDTAYVDLTHNFDLVGTENTLLIGANYLRYSFDRINHTGDVVSASVGESVDFPESLNTSIRASSYDLWGTYIQNLTKFNDQWHLLVGVRYDEKHDDITESQVSPKAGVIYHPSDNSSIYVQYSESFIPQGEVGTSYINEGEKLDAELGKSYEVGTKWELFDRRLFLTGALFETTLSNIQLSVENPDNADEDILTQDGEQVHRGAEFAAQGLVSSKLSLSGSATYLDAEITNSASYEGNVPANTPEFSASIWSNYKLRDDTNLNLGVVHVGSRYGDSGNTFKKDAYTRIDTGISYTQKYNDLNIVARFNVENLFDTDYLDGGGNTRSTQLGGEDVDIGEGRNYMASIQFEY
nr:TonB-dependent siderophore receptor [Vibrio cyclitrophicus]PMF23874.1 ligand-gated channel protein [Vibrio cyclitrophicus]